VYNAHVFDQFKGKKFSDVESALRSKADAQHLEILIHGRDAPNNIDVQSNRLNIFVNDDFVITHFTIA
jgi:hypothetical protein